MQSNPPDLIFQHGPAGRTASYLFEGLIDLLLKRTGNRLTVSNNKRLLPDTPHELPGETEVQSASKSFSPSDLT
jgi:hypothetical protein